MRRHDHLAAAPRGLVAAADAWVVQYAPTGPVSLVEREAAGTGELSVAADGDLEVLVAGTAFDLDALAAQFNLPPEAAAAPARVVLEAYRRADDRCLDLVNGRCILLIADRSTPRLLAVRDRMGVRPLFYAATGEGLLFSSSIEALLAQPEISRAVDRVVLAEHLMHRWVDPNETYFSSVRRVPPGHVLDVKGAQRSLRRYWDPRTVRPLSDDEALDRFDSVFERAVERCMGRTRSAIFLSGGFDSVSVAAAATAIARRDARPDPYALSLGFLDPDCNEQFVQRSVAQSLGLTQELVSFDQAVNGRGVLVPALEIGATWPVPILNVWTPGYYDLARRAVPHGCDAILTGTGGDEWLNVTPFLAADLIRQRDFGQLARLIGVWQRSFRLTRAQVLRNALWTFGLRPLAGEALDRIAPRRWHAERRRKLVRATHSWIAPDPALRKDMDERTERLMLPSRPGKGGYYDRELQRALDHPLVTMEYEEHFEFGRRVGARMLHPYLDPDLVQLLYGISPSALTKGGLTKGLVREAIARRFPKLGFERQRKVNATNFFRGLLQREGPAAWRSIGGTRALADLGVVQSSAFAPVVNDLFAGRRPESNYLIWSVLNLESWVRPRVPQL